MIDDGRDALQQRIVLELEELWPVVRKLDAVRQHVLIDMAFSMGVRGLLAMQRFVAAVEFHFWRTAAEEMLISQWANRDKGLGHRDGCDDADRAKRLARPQSVRSYNFS